MPAEHSSDVKFEIGHVLFIDIVGYSKLLITEQSDRLETLKRIVRGTEQVRSRRRKANCCVYRRATVRHLFFVPAPKRQSSARLRLAKSS